MNCEDKNCWAPSLESIEKAMGEASRLNAGEGDLGGGGGLGHGGFERAAVTQHRRDRDQVRGLGWKMKDKAGWQRSLEGGIWHIQRCLWWWLWGIMRFEVWGVMGFPWSTWVWFLGSGTRKGWKDHFTGYSLALQAKHCPIAQGDKEHKCNEAETKERILKWRRSIRIG